MFIIKLKQNLLEIMTKKSKNFEICYRYSRYINPKQQKNLSIIFFFKIDFFIYSIRFSFL